jgi:dTDP-4-amino-4,6-dideoxygalactose transaminase
MPLSQLAPSGTPVAIRDLLKWLLLQPAAESTLDDFRAEFCRRYQLRHCFFVSSGRAAMFLLLRVLGALAGPGKTDVIVPSYTCYSVPAAAIRAGLRVRILDIDPATLGYDLGQLAGTDFTRVLAIVSSNLYGIPNDLPAIAAIARQHGVYFIDDAAQSMDAVMDGRPVGSFGDAGLYSLDKGKNITSIQGGILTTASDVLAGEIRKELARLPGPPWQRTLSQAVQLLIYGLLLRPWLYWIPARLPFLKLGTTRYEIDYPVERYNPRLGVMGALLFRRIEAVTQRRIEAARRYVELLHDLPFLQLPEPPSGARPVYLRFPVLADTAARRERLLAALQDAGLGVTASYPRSTLDLPEVQPFLDRDHSHGDAGRSLAERILTLPTHPYVHTRHIERICSLIRQTS